MTTALSILKLAMTAALSSQPVTPVHRSAQVAASVGPTIIVAGGARNNDTHALATETDLLDTATNKWHRGADIPTPRAFPAAAALPDRVMVIGGLLDSREPSDAVETYHVADDRWSRQPPMPTRRSRMGACAIGGRVYVAGGMGQLDGRSLATLPVLERWDPTIASWERLPDMHHGRHGHAVVAYHDEVWVIGGYAPDLTDSVEIFDPRSNTWRDGPPLPEPRGFPGAGVVDDRIVVVNSRGGPARTCVILENGSWRPGPAVPDDRHRCGVAPVDHRLYLTGGERGGGERPRPHTILLDMASEKWAEIRN